MTLKEAIDMTFEKYVTDKNVDSYHKILSFLNNGNFSYITGDKNEEGISARGYVINNFHKELYDLYEEAMIGQETILGEMPSKERRINVIADYFDKQNKTNRWRKIRT